MKIETVREHLRAWGKYWSKQREGQGYASVSITEQCCKILQTQVFSQGTSHLSSHLADSIHVPDWVQVIDEATNELTEAQKAYIKLKYINFKKVENIHIRNAEVKLASLL